MSLSSAGLQCRALQLVGKQLRTASKGNKLGLIPQKCCHHRPDVRRDLFYQEVQWNGALLCQSISFALPNAEHFVLSVRNNQKAERKTVYITLVPWKLKIIIKKYTQPATACTNRKQML